MRRLARAALSASMICGLSGVSAWYARPRMSASREPDTATAAQDTSGEAAARNQLLRLDKEWGNAMIARDTAYFERTLSNDFLSVTSDSTFGKAELVQAVTSSSVAWRSWDTYRQYVRVLGNVGVVTGSLMAHGREGKRKLDEHWLYTQVFVKRAGRWQVVVGHYSRGE
jgi:hypothetical protein